MSQTFSLVCHETKKRVWIGQGWGGMAVLYSGEQETMDALKKFLNDHLMDRLQFVCDDENDFVFNYDEYGQSKTGDNNAKEKD